MLSSLPGNQGLFYKLSFSLPGVKVGYNKKAVVRIPQKKYKITKTAADRTA